MSTRNVMGFGLILTASFLMILMGCQRGPSRIEPPSINASAAGSEAMEMFDTNKDGKISGAEFDKVPSLKSNLKRLDANGDGAVTADEITDRIKFWQDVLKTGRQSVHCIVKHNGQPLADAEVKFVPEKFLGDNIKTATGKTNASGMCRLSVPLEGKDDVPGIPPGFYRVEITKPGQNIPAKYNTATILGLDCANDNESMIRGITFDLNY
jgi:Ca2+-binding EF-hand superfamily protein